MKLNCYWDGIFFQTFFLEYFNHLYIEFLEKLRTVNFFLDLEELFVH